MTELSREQLHELRGKLDNLDRATHETRDKLNHILRQQDVRVGPDLEASIQKVAERANGLLGDFRKMRAGDK